VLLVPVHVALQFATVAAPLRQEASTDDKTGLLRYEAWRRLVLREQQRHIRTGRPWAVLFCDLDNFKIYNDRHGHIAGDDALQAVAAALQAHLRPRDLLGRFGGEEFAAFLAATDSASAARIAERLREAVAALSLPAGGVTVSIGVAAVAPGEIDELASVLAQADRMLYDAKRAGRNRVYTYPEDVAPDAPRDDADWLSLPHQSIGIHTPANLRAMSN